MEDWKMVPRNCCYLIGTAGTNKIYCEQVENATHTWYMRCEELRNTGRCKHPGPDVGEKDMTEEKSNGVSGKFIYGLMLRVAWMNGEINDEKFAASQSGGVVIVEFPDRKQMVSFSVGDMVQAAYKFAVEHPDERWDKE